MNLCNKDLYFKFLKQKDSTFIKNLYNSDYSKIALSETEYTQYPFTTDVCKEWVEDIKGSYKFLKYNSIIAINTIIIIIYSRNKRIGFIQLNKINKKEKTLEIGIIIDKKFHGKGIGTRRINRICGFIFNNFNFKKITASIRNDNIISKNMFEKCGFEKTKKKERCFVIDKKYEFNIFSLKKEG